MKFMSECISVLAPLSLPKDVCLRAMTAKPPRSAPRRLKKQVNSALRVIPLPLDSCTAHVVSFYSRTESQTSGSGADIQGTGHIAP